jgi:protein-disulfide isomerase
MHDALYENQPVLGPELIEALAQEFKLDMERFESDVKSGRFRERVKHDFMGGVRSGVGGTPAFFVDGERYDGSWDEASLRTVLRAAAR